MDGLVEFSILVLFGVLSTEAPVWGDGSIAGVIKFAINVPMAILETIAIWVLIARIGSMIFIPIDQSLGVLLTLGGVLAIFFIMYNLNSRVVDFVEQHIRRALEERHQTPASNPTRELIPHKHTSGH